MIRITLYILFLTLGTYAIPTMRVSLGAEVPYAVPIVCCLAVFCFFKVIIVGASITVFPLCCIACYVGSNLLAYIANIKTDSSLSVKNAVFALSALVISEASANSRIRRVALICLLLSAVAVFVYGVFGYVTKSVGDPNEHAYNYFGVTYLPSTRNGDQLYFIVPFFLALGWYFANHRARPYIATFGAVPLVIALCTGMIFSYSRGAWLAVLIGATAAYSVFRKASSKVALKQINSVLAPAILLGSIALVIAYAGRGVTGVVLSERVSSVFTVDEREGGNSNATRLFIIQQVAAAIAKEPLGVGVGNARQILQYDAGSYANHAENVFLQVLIEQGIVGAIGFILFNVWIYFRLLEKCLRNSAEYSVIALFGLHVAFCVFGMFNNYNDNTWYWATMGLILAHANEVTARQEFQIGPREQPLHSRGREQRFV